MTRFVPRPNFPHPLEWNEKHGWVFPSRSVVTGTADMDHYVSFQTNEAEPMTDALKIVDQLIAYAKRGNAGNIVLSVTMAQHLRDGAKAERERIVSWLRGTPADAIMGLVGHALPRQQTDDIVEALASAIEADPT